ncbi:Major Facilitator Superfamily protein [Lentzea albidocapillata subsp. violacea]|uniref:Major Facilitator Superfamily protein n=1 Tax=Lentzea albidocapillata subsp. violacea TaxID=128104 RepID=A0A1G8TJ41_9PSEU|nr:MFS transporter [Lentzea albidocapillata]SDJ41579.1 Major Facilitator Superfamily protein [Lentzea albidocapillata subsp. violacea]
MYVSSVRAGLPAEPGRSHHKISATVIGLGVVSLITDLSAEMVTAVLPLYLVYGLGVGYLQLGAIDGLYTGATAVLRLAGGHLADRWQRPKAVALFGYGLSAVTRLGFPLVGSSVAGLGLLIGVDRAGKGIRTGPRDAMITLASPPDGLGRAFGVHRALDTAGALLGPLVAFGLLSLLFMDYTSVFAVSFCFAVVAVVVLAVFVRQPAGVAARLPGLSWNVLKDRQVRRVVLITALLGVCTVGDMFLFVGVQKSAGLPVAVLPLLPLVTALTFMVAAAPVGKLADRVGRWKVFLAGHVVLLLAYALVAVSWGGWLAAALVLPAHGVFYACTDGVLMAHVGPLVPEPVRATGLAFVQTGQALGRAAGAVLFGVAATGLSLAPAFGLFAAVLAVAVVVGARW